MSKWQAEKAERNRQSLARLTKALPPIFPSAVLSRALSRPFVPPTPRLAIDSYWRAHPIRADRLARALAARSGAPSGWSWQLGEDRKDGLPATFRTPPAPYRERAYARGPKLANCSLRSTGGLPRGSTRSTSRRPRRCSMSCKADNQFRNGLLDSAGYVNCRARENVDASDESYIAQIPDRQGCKRITVETLSQSAPARLHLDRSDLNENRTASANLRRNRESRDGKFANHLRDSPCLCEAGRFRAGQDASSCRRDDSGARTQSKSLPCDEGLTSRIASGRLPSTSRKANQSAS